jgi:hypothetical protein
MNISKDGLTKFNPSTSATVVLVSGELGSSEVSIGYISPEDVFVPFRGSEVLELGEQYYISHGNNVDLTVKTTGSDAATSVGIVFSAVSS